MKRIDDLDFQNYLGSHSFKKGEHNLNTSNLGTRLGIVCFVVQALFTPFLLVHIFAVALF